MSRERCQGIVLRRWPYSESSLALRVLTPVHGVMSVLAKGAYRPTSGYLGVLDTWAWIEMEFSTREDSEMATLFRCELVDRMPGLSGDVERLTAAALLAELAELAAPPGAPSGPAFLYLLGNLRDLAAGAAVTGLLCRGVLEGLDLLGLHPVLDLEGEIPERALLWFSAAEGGVLPPGSPRPQDHARRITTVQLRWLQGLVREGETGSPPARAEDQAACLTILGDFLAYHLERPLRAWTTLRRRSLAGSR